MVDPIISVSALSKLYSNNDSSSQILLGAIFPKYRKRRGGKLALNQVTFEIGRGEAVAIIGKNGSGKSTLLQILSGVLRPTAGSFKVSGHAAALLELGSSFSPDFTGRQNVILGGLLLGLTKKEILDAFDELENFSEIGEAIDQEVKTYSTGMRMRLAFAMQLMARPDVLIVDEALSVGDFFFQQKCLERVRSLIDRGMTLLFVSHDLGSVRSICQRAILLDQGDVRFDGEVNEAITRYLSEQDKNDVAFEDRIQKLVPVASPEGCFWEFSGDGFGKISSVNFKNSKGQQASTFLIGEKLRIEVTFFAEPAFPNHVSVGLFDKNKALITCVGSYSLGLSPIVHHGETPCRFTIDLELMLEAGNYSVEIALGKSIDVNRGERFDKTPALGPICVTWDYSKHKAPFTGMVGLCSQAAFSEVEFNDAGE